MKTICFCFVFYLLMKTLFAFCGFGVVGIVRRANLFIYFFSNVFPGYYGSKYVQKTFEFCYFPLMKFGVDYNCFVFCGLFRPICSSVGEKSDVQPTQYINLIPLKAIAIFAHWPTFDFSGKKCWGPDCRLFSLEMEPLWKVFQGQGGGNIIPDTVLLDSCCNRTIWYKYKLRYRYKYQRQRQIQIKIKIQIQIQIPKTKGQY